MLYAQLAALALATTALAAAGCGSTSKQSSTDSSVGASTATAARTTATTATSASGKHITPAESILIAKAGAICQRVKAQHRSMRLATNYAIAHEIPRFAAAQQATVAELSRITPPASMAHEWEKLVRSARLLASDTTKLGETAAAYHFSAIGHMVVRMDKDEQTITRLAKHNAITGCELIYF